MDDLDDFECDDFDKTLKVIVVGNGNVGKTSLTTRYAKGRYTGNYKKTIGVDFMEKRLELRDLGETVNIMIWDTAGQEEFGALTSRYYKGAGAVVYVFSTTDRASFDDLPKWQRKVEEECGRISQVLVQNKIDLVDDAAMTRREIEDMADDMEIRLFRACVQDNVNVKEVFEHLCRQYLKRGGRDDARQAVADISTLSEAAAAAALKGSQPSPSYERRSRADSDAGSTVSDGRRAQSSAGLSPSDRARGRDQERSTGWSSGRFERVEADERNRKNRRNKYDEEDDSGSERRSTRESGRKDRQRGWDRDDDGDRRGGRDCRSDRDQDRDRARDLDLDRDDRDDRRARDWDRDDRDDRRARDWDRDRGQDRKRDDRDRDLMPDRDRNRDRGEDRDRERRDRGRDRDRARGRDRDREPDRGQDKDRDERCNRTAERERDREGDRDRETRPTHKDVSDETKDRARSRAKNIRDDDMNSGDSDNVDTVDRSDNRNARERDEQTSRNKDKKASEQPPTYAPRDENEPATKEDSVRETEAEAGSPTASVRSGEFEKNERESRQNSRSMRESDQVSAKDKKSPSRPQSDKTSELDANKAFDKATLRAQLREGQDSGSKSEQGHGSKKGEGNTSANASESGRIQPSKRRTNGKKTNPLLYKLSKLVYS